MHFYDCYYACILIFVTQVGSYHAYSAARVFHLINIPWVSFDINLTSFIVMTQDLMVVRAGVAFKSRAQETIEYMTAYHRTCPKVLIVGSWVAGTRGGCVRTCVCFWSMQSCEGQA